MKHSKLLQKYKTNPTRETIEEILTWCLENVDKMNLSRSVDSKIYKIATKYLMESKLDNLSYDEAVYLINYFAKEYMNELNADLNKKMKIKVYTKEEYEKNYEAKLRGISIDSKDGLFLVSYSPRVVIDLRSNDLNFFLRGMKSIYHEIVHAMQSIVIESKDIVYRRSAYIMALEQLMRNVDRNFYDENYDNVLMENQANYQGYTWAMKVIKEYNPKLYNKYDISKINQIIEKHKTLYSEELKPKMYQKDDTYLARMDLLASIYIAHHPEYLEKYPILKLAYNSDTKKKKVRELVEDRTYLLEKGKNKENIDDLYKLLANEKNCKAGGLEDAISEMVELTDYIFEKGEDDFVFDLIRYRLKRCKYKPEQIEYYINSLKSKTNMNQEGIQK